MTIGFSSVDRKQWEGSCCVSIKKRRKNSILLKPYCKQEFCNCRNLLFTKIDFGVIQWMSYFLKMIFWPKSFYVEHASFQGLYKEQFPLNWRSLTFMRNFEHQYHTNIFQSKNFQNFSKWRSLIPKPFDHLPTFGK